MKNKAIFGVLMVCAIVTLGGFSHKANASEAVKINIDQSDLKFLDQSDFKAMGQFYVEIIEKFEIDSIKNKVDFTKEGVEVYIPWIEPSLSWRFSCTETATSPTGQTYYTHYGSNSNHSGSYCTSSGWGYSTACNDNAA